MDTRVAQSVRARSLDGDGELKDSPELSDTVAGLVLLAVAVAGVVLVWAALEVAP